MNEVVCHVDAANLFVVQWQLFAINFVVFGAIGGLVVIARSFIKDRTARRNYHV